jgi:hypothetical protein
MAAQIMTTLSPDTTIRPVWRHGMKKALFSAVLAAAIVAGVGIAPAIADDLSKARMTTSDKIDHNDKIKWSRVKRNKTRVPPVKNDAYQEDYYTSSREQMIKSAM